MDTVRLDLRHALRGLLRSPGFALVAVLTLGLGIGAATAVFSAFNAVLERSAPFPEPDRLVLGRCTRSGRLNPMVSGPDYFDYRKQSRSFSSLGAITAFTRKISLTGEQNPQRASTALVSHDLFPTLGVQPALGRHFTVDEGLPEAPTVALLSHRLWQQRFAGDPAAVGATLTVNGFPATIVGVMPAGFHFLHDADVWLPMQRDGAFADVRRFHNWLVVGRLDPGVSIASAQGEVDAISARLEQQYPESNRNKGLRLDPLGEALSENHRPRLLLLLATVTLLLLIASSNVAGLVLARGVSRRGELATRAVLGASGGRLARQLLTESAVLATLGGLLGLALAGVLSRILPALAQLTRLGIADLSLQPAVVLFALAATALTALLVGATPAVRASRSSLFEDLRTGARTSGAATGARVRSALVVVQVGVSLLLLVGSGLLLRSFVRLTSNDPGFPIEHLLTAEVSLPSSSYPSEAELIQFHTGLLDDLRALPGVSAAGMISQLPLRDPGNNIYVWPADLGPGHRDTRRSAYTRVILPGYFEAMGIPLVAGRSITSADTDDAPNAMVISQTMARTLFQGRNAIGQRVAVDFGDEEPVVFVVVGVAEDIRSQWIGSRPRMMMYHSYFQVPRRTMRIALRTAMEPSELTSAVRAAVWQRDKDLPVEELASLSELVEDSVSPQRLLATVTAAFAGVALLLTVLGLFGVLAHTVGQRTHEIGLRMALGARRSQVLGLVLRQGLLLTAGGVVVGAAAALGLTRLMEGLLFDVVPSDPLSFAIAALLLLTASLAACLAPAWRATRVQPMQALRHE